MDAAKTREPTHTHRLYAAIEALPEGVVGEIMHGGLHVHPRPAARHSAVATRLMNRLGPPFDFGEGGPGGWWILDEPELHFQRDTEILVPDIAGWRRARMPQLPDDQRFEVVPDWVCEVLSPSTASQDREIKMPLYARYGVNHAWLVDPRVKRVEAYSRDGNAWQHVATFGDDQRIVAPPFDAVALPPPWVD
jgi:hypothetical protein